MLSSVSETPAVGQLWSSASTRHSHPFPPYVTRVCTPPSMDYRYVTSLGVKRPRSPPLEGVFTGQQVAPGGYAPLDGGAGVYAPPLLSTTSNSSYSSSSTTTSSSSPWGMACPSPWVV